MTENRFKFQNVDESCIIKIFKELKPKSSTDHEGMSVKILKNVSTKLASPLAIIVNQSLNSGIVPQALKVSKVNPVFKKNDNTLCDNYRPIALLPTISKILEKIVHKQLITYLINSKLLFNSQHGFRQNHSTGTATIEFNDNILKHLDNNETPVSIFLDLTKAFDTLNHDILLYKLSCYGIHNTALDWFNSYLSQRYQYVEYLNCHSSKLPITTGVPQGSILGPLLFNIYINDINKASTVFDFELYADDTTLTCTLERLSPLLTRETNFSDIVNKELHNIFIWLSVNKLSLNASKTKYILFHLPQKYASRLEPLKLIIDGLQLSRTKEFDYLGTVISETLSWKPQINKICNKLAKTIGILKRLKNTIPQYSLLLLYNSLFLSTINYSTLVWGLAASERITKLQKKAVRLICREKYNAHTDTLFKKLNILKFNDIVKQRSFAILF